MTQQLSLSDIQSWLKRHSVETRIVSGKLECLDVMFKDGEDCSRWIAAPTTLRSLREWMGY